MPAKYYLCYLAEALCVLVAYRFSLFNLGVEKCDPIPMPSCKALYHEETYKSMEKEVT